MKKVPGLGLDARFYRYLLPHTHYLILAVVMMVLVAALEVVAPWPLKFIVDNVIGGEPLGAVAGAWTEALVGNDPRVQTALFGSLIVLFAALTGLLQFTYEYLQSAIQEHTTFRLRSDAFAHVATLSLQFHDRGRTGELISRVNGDSGRVMEALVTSAGALVVNACKFAGIAGVMLYVNWRFSVIVLAFAPLLAFLYSGFRRNVKAAAQAARAEEGQLVTVTQETVSAIRVVKAFGREADELRRFQVHGTARMRAGLRSALWEAASEPVLDTVKAIGTAAVVWFGVSQILDVQLTVGELLVFLSYLSAFYSPLKRFSRLSAAMQKATVSGERLAELFDNSQVTRDAPGAVSLKRAAGRVEFQGVCFAYDGAQPVLKGVSFVARPGQTVALVGSTGAGKTTVAHLLPRFYDVTGGRILLDGRDVRNIRLADLRRQFGLVSQEPILFASSIRDNIAYGTPRASTAEIVAAARAANAHEFITQLPDGYDTAVGERGVTLSGGQRQRIAIARAILRNAPILILDEPTASLDAAAEQEVMSAVDRLTQARTTFIIAHRLSTVRNADQILVLEEGQIIERGRHADLVARGAAYAELVRLQQQGSSGGPEPDNG